MILLTRPRLIREPITQIEVERLALILEARRMERKANRLLLIGMVTFLTVVLGLLVVSAISSIN